MANFSIVNNYVNLTCFKKLIIIFFIIIRVFAQGQVRHCKVHAQEPRPQFCRRQVFHRKLRNQGCSFTRDWIGTLASRCFPHPSFYLAFEQTLKIWKDPRGNNVGVRRVDFLTGSSGFHRNSPQALNNSSIRDFDLIRDPEFPSPFAPNNHFCWKLNRILLF